MSDPSEVSDFPRSNFMTPKYQIKTLMVDENVVLINLKTSVTAQISDGTLLKAW